MATFGEGLYQSRPSLDSQSSDHNPFLVTAPSNTTTMRAQFQALLDEKERQLQAAGNLGQRILAQQMELEERINALSELEYRNGSRTPELGGDPEMRKRLEDLENVVQTWQVENDQTLESFGQKVSGLGLRRLNCEPLFADAFFITTTLVWRSECLSCRMGHLVHDLLRRL